MEGNLKNGKPCINCKNTLIEYGFKTVIYSTNEGTLIKSNIISLNSKESSGTI